MQPQLNISTLVVYLVYVFINNISGATNPGVPHLGNRNLRKEYIKLFH